MRRLFCGVALLVALCAASARAVVVNQHGNLRVSVDGRISPQALPRDGAAPISVSVEGHVTTLDESLPPLLRVLTIEINRNGHFDYRGLPICPYGKIQPATDGRALSACRSSLVGQGTFSAYVVLRGEEPYPATGRLLVFNGRQHGQPVLLGHIYLAKPFASSFVIVFTIANQRRGAYGTTLTANLVKALGTRRYLTGIDMTLSRTFSAKGTRHSYLSSGCPAPKGFTKAVFPLVRATFRFAQGDTFASTLPSTCRVRR